jgi:chromosome segregation ATPase
VTIEQDLDMVKQGLAMWTSGEDVAFVALSRIETAFKGGRKLALEQRDRAERERDALKADVGRLNVYGEELGWIHPDEVERLRGMYAEQKKMLWESADEVEQLQAERDALKVDLEQARMLKLAELSGDFTTIKAQRDALRRLRKTDEANIERLIKERDALQEEVEHLRAVLSKGCERDPLRQCPNCRQALKKLEENDA